MPTLDRRDGLIGASDSKRRPTLRALLVIVALFAADFGAWAAFPAASFLAFVALLALLATVVLLYVASPWDRALLAALAIVAVSSLVGLLTSGR